ncbi:hypothetical protein BH23BAC3_BH23BAC3_23440 [soil metagenome]
MVPVTVRAKRWAKRRKKIHRRDAEGAKVFVFIDFENETLKTFYAYSAPWR